MARKRGIVSLSVDDEGCIVDKVFDPRAWPFELEDVTGDAERAVKLLRDGVPVRCARDDKFITGVKRLYAEKGRGEPHGRATQ